MRNIKVVNLLSTEDAADSVKEVLVLYLALNLRVSYSYYIRISQNFRFRSKMKY